MRWGNEGDWRQARKQQQGALGEGEEGGRDVEALVTLIYRANQFSRGAAGALVG